MNMAKHATPESSNTACLRGGRARWLLPSIKRFSEFNLAHQGSHVILMLFSVIVRCLSTLGSASGAGAGRRNEIEKYSLPFLTDKRHGANIRGMATQKNQGHLTVGEYYLR